MNDVSSRQRLLKLIEILKNDTDEDHQLPFGDILKKFQFEFGSDFTINKKVFREDIKVLNKAGIEIIENEGKYGAKLYSHQHRLFGLHELRMLIDAVISAKFITVKDSVHLIEKIKKLTSKPKGKLLQSGVFIDESTKTNNLKMKYVMADLHTAITQMRKIKFQYGKYNLEKEFVLQRDGDSYSVNPYGLIWNNDFYYLIGEYEPNKEIRHYRVDRIRNVTLLEDNFNKRYSFNMSEYINKSFHMYSGEEWYIHIRFKNKLINVIIDRFGTDANIQKFDEEWFLLKTKAVVSEGLIRWILTWGSDAKVVYPDFLIIKLKNEAEKMFNLYHEVSQK
jgi:predicted DNA-binding transcriptional regulator YafY